MASFNYVLYVRWLTIWLNKRPNVPHIYWAFENDIVKMLGIEQVATAFAQVNRFWMRNLIRFSFVYTILTAADDGETKIQSDLKHVVVFSSQRLLWLPQFLELVSMSLTTPFGYFVIDELELYVNYRNNCIIAAGKCEIGSLWLTWETN